MVVAQPFPFSLTYAPFISSGLQNRENALYHASPFAVFFCRLGIRTIHTAGLPTCFEQLSYIFSALGTISHSHLDVLFAMIQLSSKRCVVLTWSFSHTILYHLQKFGDVENTWIPTPALRCSTKILTCLVQECIYFTLNGHLLANFEHRFIDEMSHYMSWWSKWSQKISMHVESIYCVNLNLKSIYSYIFAMY